MSIVTAVVLTIAGTYLIVIGQLMRTRSIQSGIVFKVLPTLIGIACYMLSLKTLGWI